MDNQPVPNAASAPAIRGSSLTASIGAATFHWQNADTTTGQQAPNTAARLLIH